MMNVEIYVKHGLDKFKLYFKDHASQDVTRPSILKGMVLMTTFH